MIRILLFPALLTACSLAAQTTHQLVAVDFEFIPPVIEAVQGDSLHVVFNSPEHTLTQVDETTWNANGNTPSGIIDLGPGATEVTLALDASGIIYYVCAPHAAMGMKGIIDVALTSGVGEFTPVRSALYPNPANDLVLLRHTTDRPVHITLTDAMGRTVLEVNMLGTAPLFVGDLSPGLYHARVVVDGGNTRYAQVLMVQH